jgi:hypothetical protein
MPPDIVDLLAILLGILFGVRRHTLRSQQAHAPAGVDQAAYARWYRRELVATTTLSSACFAKIILDYGLLLLAPKIGLAPAVQWPMAAAIDIGWMLVMLAGLYLRASARHLKPTVGTDRSK